ncbi:MAG: hypothetical protein AVDCRST_MAG77-2207 [uncultured Chloroflexi bacterium]|uniref:Uncharacterized protein n=1 Tax=uncultured Chloroflexota bacterium TaxID=166587 RepID=A0A6J4IL22_9CHLR|nr:MAG: hypothetical protein AVDCRST_MAG77-2207 [uncultured Chloroflexota bacterium]
MELQQNGAPQWRIVSEHQVEDVPARFAVLRDNRRVVWGLRDQDAASRWLRRLSLPVQAPLALVTAH